MGECFSCGISDEKVLLYDAISSEGIVKICKICSFKEDIPILKNPNFPPKEEDSLSVKDRLSKISGFQGKKAEKSDELKRQEILLKGIADANALNALRMQKRNDLIDNFHWVLMRARRIKHLSQSQLAQRLSESESVIRMAERGILPNDYRRLINKLENFLEVRLTKSRSEGGFFIKPKEVMEVKEPSVFLSQSESNIPPSERRFDPMISKNIKISDLQEMKNQGEISGKSRWKDKK